MLLSLLAACGSISAGDPPADSAQLTGPDETDSAPPAEDSAADPYVVEDDPVQPALTLDEVADGVTDALRAVHAVDAGDMFDAYDQAMSARSTACPYTDDDYDVYGVDYWYDSCTADSGSHYSGYGYGYHYTDWWQGQYYYRHNGYWFGDAKVERPDGSALTVSGYAYHYDYDDTTYGASGYYYSLTGEFSSTSPDWADTWLADDLSVSLSLSRYWYGADLGTLQITGGISHLDGLINAVELDHLYMVSAAQGSQCTLEPGGTISIRDATGDWYDVTFQGPTTGSTTAFPAECDGCGEVWFRGEPLGDVCPDLSSLLTWGS